MKTSRILRIKRKLNWIDDFPIIEYDGKYIGLHGKDSNHPVWWQDVEIEYEDMVYGGAFAEGRKLRPILAKTTKDFYYIDIGSNRESLAWTKLVEDDIYGLVFDPDYFEYLTLNPKHP